ncbi:MAG: PCRF domain-containing protein, partial [Pseudomonadota bacterium]
MASVSEIKSRAEKLFKILALEEKKQRLSVLETELSSPDVWNNREKAQTLNKEATQIRKVIAECRSIERKIADAAAGKELLDAGMDEELFKDLNAQLIAIEKQLKEMEFKRMLSGESDHMGAVLTINAGAGGTDAQDWANMLLRMYTRWIERKGYKYEVVDYQAGEEAGIKSATVMVDGDYAYGYLKAENGIHRVVRISPFDSNARRHTSFA